jgi:hypothetical protein
VHKPLPFCFLVQPMAVQILVVLMMNTLIGTGVNVKFVIFDDSLVKILGKE